MHGKIKRISQVFRVHPLAIMTIQTIGWYLSLDQTIGKVCDALLYILWCHRQVCERSRVRTVEHRQCRETDEAFTSVCQNIGRKPSSHHSLHNARCWYTSSVMGRGERKRQRETTREGERPVMAVHLSNKLLTDNTSSVLTHGQRRLQLSACTHTHTSSSQLNQQGLRFFAPNKTKTLR